jgi:hypothetical protein
VINVSVSGLSGTVENVSIRIIRLRAADGSVHIIPFSAVTTITNSSRGAGNTAVSVNVAYKEDTDRAGQLLIVAEMVASTNTGRQSAPISNCGASTRWTARWPRSSARFAEPTAAAGQCSANSTGA